VVDLPSYLLDEALGVDVETARAAVDDHAVGYRTVEGGRRPSGRAALPVFEAESETDSGGDATAYDRLIEALCDVLRERYDDVSRDGDRVVATERAFDPAAAADLGVDEGPAFGRLAGGESVDVAGRRIDPEEVHRDRTVTFLI
jgi:D-aminoacyl-tRNA deacylase